jgi:hypothetical protein
VVLHRATGHSSPYRQAPLTEGKLIFLAEGLQLSKRKRKKKTKNITFAGSKLIFLVCLWSYFPLGGLFNREHSEFYFLCILLDKGVSSFRPKLLLQNTLQITTLEALPKQRLR